MLLVVSVCVCEADLLSLVKMWRLHFLDFSRNSWSLQPTSGFFKDGSFLSFRALWLKISQKETSHSLKLWAWCSSLLGEHESLTHTQRLTSLSCSLKGVFRCQGGVSLLFQPKHEDCCVTHRTALWKHVTSLKRVEAHKRRGILIIFTLELYFLRSLHLAIRRIMRRLVMGVTSDPPGPGEPMTGWFFLKDKCCKVICSHTMRLSGLFKRRYTGRNCHSEKNKTPHHHEAPTGHDIHIKLQA